MKIINGIYPWGFFDMDSRKTIKLANYDNRFWVIQMTEVLYFVTEGHSALWYKRRGILGNIGPTRAAA
jgi:hypothetical protein